MAEKVHYASIRKSVLVCGYLAQVLFFGWLGFSWFLMGNRPEFADFGRDLVHPLTNKGRTVFISNGEEIALSVLGWGTVALVGIVGIAWLIDRRNRRKGNSEMPLLPAEKERNSITLGRFFKVLLLIQLIVILLILMF